MIFEALGILKYSTIAFLMGTDWGVIVFDMGLEE
jgi:hypothetical protein